jgi:hypothetical protein
VPEQLALEQGPGNRTVDGKERLTRKQAGLMNSASHYLFPRAGFSQDDHISVGLGHLVYVADEFGRTTSWCSNGFAR